MTVWLLATAAGTPHRTFNMLFVGGRHRGRDRTVTGAKTKRQPRNELREKSQIVKERTKRAAKTAFQLHRTEQRRKRKGTNSRFKHK